MQNLWKLLDLKEHEYSAHETEEEINHIIEYKIRNMEDDRVIRRIDIKTPFPNYNFQYVIAFDSENVYYFLYFFDSIEEQCDCFEEELYEREELISDMCEHVTHIKVHHDVDIDEIMSEHENAFEAMESFYKEALKSKEQRIVILEAGLEECEKSCEFYKKEIRKLENEKNRLANIINKTEASGVQPTVLPTDNQYIKNLEHLLDEVRVENAELEKALAQRDKMLEQIRDAIYPF